MKSLQERAAEAAQLERSALKKKRAAENRETEKKMLPGAAKEMSRIVGRRVAQKALTNRKVVELGGYPDKGTALLFDFDGERFAYRYSLEVEVECPDCGEKVLRSFHDLAGLGKVLHEAPKWPWHSCFESAVKQLRSSARAYAGSLKTSETELLSRAAGDTIFT